MSYATLLRWPRSLRLAMWLGSLLLVAVLGGLPGTYRPAMADSGWAYLSNLLHQPLYALVGLGFLLALRRPSNHLGDWMLVALYAVGVGILDEIHQAHTVERFSSLWDLGSDGYGAFCAGYLAHLSQSPAWPRRIWLSLTCLVAVGLAWNCLPAFAPEIPLPFLR